MRSREPAMFAVCCGLWVVGFGARASAYSCVPPRELVPEQGATFPGTGQLLDICYYYTFNGESARQPLCGAPVLEDSEGRSIELFVERQARLGVAPVGSGVARVITAYRPASSLAPGRYRFSATEFEVPQTHELSVAEGVATAAVLPVLSGVEFSRGLSGFSMIFSFEPFDGALAVERDGLVREPFEALDIAWPQPDQHRQFWLTTDVCQPHLPELDYGVSTTLRFGVLDTSGSFSGWTEPQLYTFPTPEALDAQAAERRAATAELDRQASDGTPPGWCSFSLARRAPLSSGRWLLALAALSFTRSRSARRPTVPERL